MQYRIYWKTRDGGRYATKDELSDIYLTPVGKVKLIEIHGSIAYRNDITDQVVVEMWTGETDVLGIKIFHHDKIEVLEAGNLICIGEVCWENGAWQLEDGCTLYDLSNYTLQIVGTVHDGDKEAEA